ncbi:MAG: hypothetical protein ACLQO1_09875 [Steroidobacteraceae bacterium]
MAPVDGLTARGLNFDSTAVGTNAAGLAFIGSTAYVSTFATTVLACPANADGTFGVCTTLNDPTFNGTAGMAVR